MHKESQSHFSRKKMEQNLKFELQQLKLSQNMLKSAKKRYKDIAEDSKFVNKDRYIVEWSIR